MPRQMVPARRRAKMVGVGPTKCHRFGLRQFGMRPSPGMGLEISLHGSNLGQPMSALPPKADIALHRSECPLCAKSRPMQCSINCNDEGTCDEGGPSIGPPSDLHQLGDFRAAVFCVKA